MTQNALIAFGTLVKLGDATGLIFATIPELTGALIPGSKHERKDVSTHDNVAFVKEYVAGMADVDAAALPGNWLPTNPVHMDLQQLNASGATRKYKTYLNAAVVPTTVITSTCYVAEYSPTAPVDDVYKLALSLQPTAPATYGSS